MLHWGWDALGAIGSFGQFIVVVAAAFFGAAQLRHLRRHDVLLPNFGWQIITTFDLMRPWVALRRRTLPATWAPLEALAVRARAIRSEDRLSTVRKQLPPRLRDAFDRSLEQKRTAAPLENPEPVR